jgi:carbonic anhydrase
MLPPNEAFVIRNGGGRTAEESVVRTLALIQVLSEVKEIKVVHHTGKYTHTRAEREREKVVDFLSAVKIQSSTSHC